MKKYHLAWHGLSLRQRFTLVVGLGVVVLVALVVLVIARFEEAAMERKLNQMSVNEMTSLHAFIVNVMAKRPEDGDNIGIQVFNNWFDSRNLHYPGKVWSVWGPKVTAHMNDVDPGRAAKAAQDDVDRDALAEGKPIGRMVGDVYRYSMPIVLGVTDGATQAVCHDCHGGMGLKDGEVIAVLSSSLSVVAERNQLSSVILTLILGGVAAAAFAVIGMHWILGVFITRPIGIMTHTMGKLADGNTAVEVTFQERHDEIGNMARALEIFKEHIIEADTLREAQDEARERATADREEALHAMADQFDATVKVKVARVEDSTNGIQNSAQSMARRSERSGSRSLDVGQAALITTERSAAAAAATRKLAQSVNDVAQQVEQSAVIAQRAVADVDATEGRMAELAQTVQSIGAVVNMISAIAAKTNLLALNATIEAARAGDAGKGFAVVAEEVKHLASQTASATEEITRQVNAVQASTDDMRNSIGGVVETIRTVNDISMTIAEAIKEQEAAAHEIETNINEVATQANHVSRSVSELSKASAQSCAGTVRVIWCATALSKVVDELRVEAEQFLLSVRNADKGDTTELF